MTLKVLILTFYSIVFTMIAHAHCPIIDLESHQTKNNMGKSSYFDRSNSSLFFHLINKKALNLKKSVLIVGGGYGAGIYELFNLGAQEIYFNDLDNHNLQCAKKFIDQYLIKHHTKIKYLPGSIADNSILKLIPDKSLGLVYAKNIIPLLSPVELLSFIHNSNNKLEHNGLLLFIFENPILEQQLEIVNKIKNEYKHHKKFNNRITLDAVIKDYYRKDNKCSATDYESTPITLRENGFPCIIHNKNLDFAFNFLMPIQLTGLLEKNGFIVIGSTTIINHEETFIIVAKKV